MKVVLWRIGCQDKRGWTFYSVRTIASKQGVLRNRLGQGPGTPKHTLTLASVSPEKGRELRLKLEAPAPQQEKAWQVFSRELICKVESEGYCVEDQQKTHNTGL